MNSEFEYDNILNLARKHNFKKIMIMRNSWNTGNWCIVNKIVVKPGGKYAYATGHIHYANGNKTNGTIQEVCQKSIKKKDGFNQRFIQRRQSHLDYLPVSLFNFRGGSVQCSQYTDL